MIQKELKDTLKLLSPSGSIVSLDIETTGLSPDKDMIIEIAATKLNIEEETYEYFSELINPGIDISEFITDLTGIRNEDVDRSPAVDELKKEFTSFYNNEKGEQHLIIAHNANFDIEFLKKNGFLFNGVIIDTYDLVFVLLDKAEYNLQALSNRFNIKVENLNSHIPLNYSLYPGDLSIHHCNIVHFAPPNTSKNPRISVAVRFQSQKDYIDKNKEKVYRTFLKKSKRK